MKCKKCEERQKESRELGYHWTWKDTELQIRGCYEHVKDFFNFLGRYIDEEYKRTERIRRLEEH